MGMPQIPEGTNRPNYNELIIDLLESVALDHMSMSHVINAQGELLQEMLKKYSCQQISITELMNACSSTNTMLNDTIMKEWLLQKRLDTIVQIQATTPPPANPNTTCTENSHNCNNCNRTNCNKNNCKHFTNNLSMP